MRKGVSILIRLVPRVQHFAMLAGLMAICKQSDVFIRGIHFVGDFYDSPVIADMLKVLSGMTDVRHRPGVKLSGEAVAELLNQHTHFDSLNRKDAAAQDSNEFVMFLDDDCVLTPTDLFSLMDRSDWYCGCIGIQSGLMPELQTLIVQPSFDLFCSVIPFWAFNKMSESSEFCFLLSKCNGGGEFFLMDWFLRKVGVRFNIYPGSIYHAFVQDKFKIWGSWSADKWNNLYRVLSGCRDLSQARIILADYGCLDKEVQ